MALITGIDCTAFCIKFSSNVHSFLYEIPFKHLNFLHPILQPPSHTASYCPFNHLPLTTHMQCQYCGRRGSLKQISYFIFAFYLLFFKLVARSLSSYINAFCEGVSHKVYCSVWGGEGGGTGGKGGRALFFAPTNPPSPPLAYLCF